MLRNFVSGRLKNWSILVSFGLTNRPSSTVFPLLLCSSWESKLLGIVMCFYLRRFTVYVLFFCCVYVKTNKPWLGSDWERDTFSSKPVNVHILSRDVSCLCEPLECVWDASCENRLEDFTLTLHTLSMRDSDYLWRQLQWIYIVLYLPKDQLLSRPARIITAWNAASWNTLCSCAGFVYLCSTQWPHPMAEMSLLTCTEELIEV